ncbi:MAG: alpha-2-macroglobulin [Bdellovibrionota bacterium]
MNKVTAMLGRVKSRLIAFTLMLFTLLRRGLGSFSYQSPEWWKKLNVGESKLGLKIRHYLGLFIAWKNAHKRIMWSAYGITFVALTSWGGWYYYKYHMPHPEWITMTVTEPTPMYYYPGSKPNPVRVTFSKSAADLKIINTTLEKGVSLSPAHKGRWYFESDSVLAFQPEAEWTPGTTYSFSMDKTIFEKSAELTDYSGTFKTHPFAITVTSSEFNQHPTIPKEKKGVFALRFNYPVEASSFSDRVSSEMVDEKGNSKNIRYTIQYGPEGVTANIHSEFLAVPERDSKLHVYIKDGVKSTLGGNTTDKMKTSVDVPGMFNYFKITEVSSQVIRNEKFIPEHVLIVTTTAGARSEDVAKKIKSWTLPMDNPDFERNEEDDPNPIEPWQSAGEVSRDVKKKMTPLSLELIPSEFENSTIHTFRYKGEVNRWAFVTIEKGLKSFGDYILADTFEQVFLIPAFTKELMIMHHGSILSLQGERKIPLLSRNVGEITYTLRRMRPNDLHHFVSQTSGSFQNPQFANSWKFAEENISETFTDTIKVDITDPTKTNYHSFDFSKYLNSQALGGARGIFFFSAMDKNDEGTVSQRFIVLTDLGLITKTDAKGDTKVFVQSFSTGRPVSGAKVDVLALNGTVILSETTDGNGTATFPKLTSFEREKRAIAFVARMDNDYTFLPLNAYERNIDLSRFDISGLQAYGDADRIQAFVFTDRGIYRPGDSTNFGVIAKNLSWNPLPKGLPLEFVVTNPAGSVLMREKFNLKDDGFTDFNYSTTEESPTGSYSAQVYVIKDKTSEMLGSVNFKVEEFLPDRMKILTTLSKESPQGWVRSEELKAKVLLTNLFGTAAQNRRVSAEFRLVPGFPSTRAFSDYVFINPRKAQNSYTERLEDGSTNDEGEAEFDLDLKKFDDASYRLEFVAQGFEAEGGRSVSSSVSVYISPAPHVIGYKADGDLNYMRLGDKRKVHILALDPSMKKVGVKGLKSKLIEMKYVSVLTQQGNGTYKYQSVKKETPVGSPGTVNIGATGLNMDIDTTKDGTFVYVIYDNEGLEYARIGYSVIAPSGLARGLEKNAELQIALNKTDYEKGEEIELQIRAPYTGAGLITIERGQVYSHIWFKTTSETSVQKIKIPDEVEGNGYVSVVFLRSLDSKEIYTSPLSYGVAPFTISRKSRMTEISLDAPEIVRPGDKLNIKYSANRPTSLVLYGVDEGILQVAGYKLPDPLSFFFTKRALQVQTSQILDLLLPELSIFESLSASGGDEGGDPVALNLNPFKRRRDKPVVFWSGVIKASEKEQVFHYEVPDYFNGSMRLMAVAAADAAVGNRAIATTIRGDVVLSPNVPLFVTPGDEFEVSVGVSNTAAGSKVGKDIKLSLDTSEHLEILSSKESVLEIKEGSEKSQTFRLRAKNKLGSASIKFVVNWKGKMTKSVTDLSLRPAVPFMTELHMGLTHDANAGLPVTRKMYPEFRTLTLAASELPISLADGLMKYLEKYPYGCTEQIISIAFPTLVLSKNSDFKISQDFVRTSYTTTLKTLRRRTTETGGFGLWDNTEEEFDFPTLYAVHYLTEANDMGLSEGRDLLDRSLQYLRSERLEKADSIHQARLWAYSLYLQARNGIVPKKSLETLRGLLNVNYKDVWRGDLTAAYLAATYTLLKQNDEGAAVMKSWKKTAKDNLDWNFFYGPGVRETQYLYLASLHFPDVLKDMSAEDLSAMLAPVMNGGYTTTNSSYAILALDAYVRVRELSGSSLISDAKFLETWKGGEKLLALTGKTFFKTPFTDKADAIAIRNPKKLNVFWQTTEAGFDHTLPVKTIESKMEIQREYLDMAKKPATTVKNGDELWVRIRTRTTRDTDYVDNVALVDLLPGGFEVVMDSIRNSEENNGSTFLPRSVDIREDRVVIFGTVRSEMKEYLYKIKATNIGTFVVPPPFAESMYDRDIKSRGLAGKMTVTKP